MRVLTPDDWAWAEPISPPQMTVLITEARESLVLDQNGNNFRLEKRHPVGFDLRKKNE